MKSFSTVSLRTKMNKRWVAVLAGVVGVLVTAGLAFLAVAGLNRHPYYYSYTGTSGEGYMIAAYIGTIFLGSVLGLASVFVPSIVYGIKNRSISGALKIFAITILILILALVVIMKIGIAQQNNQTNDYDDYGGCGPSGLCGLL